MKNWIFYVVFLSALKRNKMVYEIIIIKTRELVGKFSSPVTQICCVEEASAKLSDPFLNKELKKREKCKCKQSSF